MESRKASPAHGEYKHISSPSAEFYQHVVREIREYAIFLLNADGVIISWNCGVEQVFGYDEAEFIGQQGEIIFTPEDREHAEPQRELEKALRDGQALDDRYLVRKDGSRFWANGVTTALRNTAGEFEAFVKVVRDNSKEKVAQERLKRGEERFYSLFRTGPFAAALTTPEEDRFMDVNDAYEQLTGYSRDHVIGRTSKELGMWSSKKDQAKLQKVLQDGHDFRNLELQLRTQDGHVRDILASGTFVSFDGTRCALKMFYDITERKRSEEELQEAIQHVMQDAAWFSRAVVERLTNIRSSKSDHAEVADLTNRERQVLERIARGMNNDEIATNLGIGVQTVRNYVSTIYSKINVKSRAEAVVWARERGLVGS
jgi:PAS domain S-box-containing protein